MAKTNQKEINQLKRYLFFRKVKAWFSSWTGFAGKSLWDWFGLLVPATISIAVLLAGYSFSEQQRLIQTELEMERQRESALQDYLDDMGNLMIENKLNNLEENDQVRALGRARTLTILEMLDEKRKIYVVHFLYESNLLTPDNRIISLTNAHLRDIDMNRAILIGINLSGADLRSSNLSWSSMDNSILVNADLSGSNLEAILLRESNLAGAEFNNANLNFALLTNSNMYAADFDGAILTYAELINSDFTGAFMRYADLRGANLENANLTFADLSYANLYEANVTNEQLASALSLKNATMPDGTKYEEWKKSH